MSFAGTSESDDVFAIVDDGVGTITLNRPARRNALSAAMLEGLADLVPAMEAADEIGAIVLTGAGGAFCSGGDVRQFDEDGGVGGGATEVDPVQVADQQQSQRATVGRLHRSPKPVLAALPGAAAGAGLGLALAADLRIGTPRTLLATAFGAVGLSGDYGVAWLLRQLVGPAKAREMLFLTTRVGADEALGLGLLNWLVGEDELESRTHEIARKLAHGPRQALSSMKLNLVDAQHLDLEASMDDEVVRHKATGVTADHIGAVRAFVEKRTPVFGADRERPVG